MAFTITHVDGRMTGGEPGVEFDALIEELRLADDDHPDIAVSHETGMTVSVFRGGLVVVEDVEDVDGGEPRSAHARDRDELILILEAVASGRFSDLDGLATWHPWFRPPNS